MTMTTRWPACALALCLAACSGGGAPADAGATDAIVAAMHATWDRPEQPLEAGPVVVAGDLAVADWTQGEAGGRALLRRAGAGWETVLCAGDGIRTAEGLQAVGVPAEQATRLARALADAERSVAPARLARMARFAGVVRMDAGDDGHGAHH